MTRALVRAVLALALLDIVAHALVGCAGPVTFAPAGHGYDPLMADAVRATMER